MEKSKDYEYRKIQGLVGETSFSIIIPKTYAIRLGVNKGDHMKVMLENNRIILEKAGD